MHCHRFLEGGFRVFFLTWWHVCSKAKKLVLAFVEGRPIEGTKSTNSKYANQAHEVVNALA